MPRLLLIADGFGLSTAYVGNAVVLAKPQMFTYLWQRSTHAVLRTDPIVSVERPIDAESAHFALGTGMRPNFESNDQLATQLPSLTALLQESVQGTKRLHVAVNLSILNVAQAMKDIEQIANAAAPLQVQVILQVILGGPDAPKQGSIRLLESLAARLRGVVIGSVAGYQQVTGQESGAEYLKRLQKGYIITTTPAAYIEAAYRDGEEDSMILEAIFSPEARLAEGDSWLLLVPGGAPYLTLMGYLASSQLPGFLFPHRLPKLHLWSLRRIAPLKGAVKALIYPAAAHESFPYLLSQAGKRVLKIATSEKMDLLSFAINGGSEEVLPTESIQELRIPHYTLEEEVSGLRNAISAGMAMRDVDLIIAHFSGIDRAVHARDINLAAAAISACDGLLRQLSELCVRHHADLLFSSAHGGAESMLSGAAIAETSAVRLHSRNPVPFLVHQYGKESRSTNPLALDLLGSRATLLDVAPTICELFDIAQPATMEGQSILQQVARSSAVIFPPIATPQSLEALRR